MSRCANWGIVLTKGQLFFCDDLGMPRSLKRPEVVPKKSPARGGTDAAV